MRNLDQPLLLVVFVMLFSCSSNEQKKQVIKSPVREKVVANQIMVAEVEGMVCKMGCGGVIRKTMIETKAVSQVDIDYQDGLKKQTIKIHFDDKLITQAQLIRKLEKINNNQFSVFPIGTSELESSSSSSNSTSGVNMSESTLELPNLIGILSSFITE
jgi:hypothetical protein